MLEAKDKLYIQSEILRVYPGTDPEIDIDWDMAEIAFKSGRREVIRQIQEKGVACQKGYRGKNSWAWGLGEKDYQSLLNELGGEANAR